jgi:hypothetical protein
VSCLSFSSLFLRCQFLVIVKVVLVCGVVVILWKKL